MLKRLNIKSHHNNEVNDASPSYSTKEPRGEIGNVRRFSVKYILIMTALQHVVNAYSDDVSGTHIYTRNSQKRNCHHSNQRI